MARVSQRECKESGDKRDWDAWLPFLHPLIKILDMSEGNPNLLFTTPFPPSRFFSLPSQACALDPMLDDSVMFAKRLRNINQPVTLCVVDDLPHGFLSLSQLCSDTKEAANVCVERIRAVFTQKDTPPEPRKHRKLERTDRGVSASPGEDGSLFVGPIERGELAVRRGTRIADGEGLVAVAAQNNTDTVGIGP